MVIVVTLLLVLIPAVPINPGTMMSLEGLRPNSSGRKPLGKLASRLEEVKNPWRQGSSGLELSHSEAARLATDALLELGEKEYRRVLTEERELNFLSPMEVSYITQHAARAADTEGPGPGDRDFGDGDAVSELTSGTYFPMMSDEEPPMLELGWPEPPARYGPSETQIYFQRDKSHNVKDLIRSLINKAKQVRSGALSARRGRVICIAPFIRTQGKSLGFSEELCL